MSSWPHLYPATIILFLEHYSSPLAGFPSSGLVASPCLFSWFPLISSKALSSVLYMAKSIVFLKCRCVHITPYFKFFNSFPFTIQGEQHSYGSLPPLASLASSHSCTPSSLTSSLSMLSPARGPLHMLSLCLEGSSSPLHSVKSLCHSDLSEIDTSWVKTSLWHLVCGSLCHASLLRNYHSWQLNSYLCEHLLNVCLLH